MSNEPIHYVPVVEQRYAEIIQNLEQHPARKSVGPQGPAAFG